MKSYKIHNMVKLYVRTSYNEPKSTVDVQNPSVKSAKALSLMDLLTFTNGSPTLVVFIMKRKYETIFKYLQLSHHRRN